MPNTAGIVTNIHERVFACRNAPIKYSCFTLDFRRAACAKNLFKDQKDAVGDHLSSEIVPFCRSPLTTNHVFSLSRVPLLFTLTLKVSIIGVLVSPFSILSKAKVPLSIRVFNSFLTDFNHSDFTILLGSLMMSLIVLGAGSQELASKVLGIIIGWASLVQASTSALSSHEFAHSTALAMLTYLKLGLLTLVERRKLSLLSMTNSSGSGGDWECNISYGVVESSESDSLLAAVSPCVGGTNVVVSAPVLVVSSSSIAFPSSTVGKSSGLSVYSIISVVVGIVLRTGRNAKLSRSCCQVRAIAEQKNLSNVTSSEVMMCRLSGQ